MNDGNTTCVIDIIPAKSCCILELSDGSSISLGVSVSTVQAWLSRAFFPSVAVLIEQRRIEVLSKPFNMTQSQWESITAVLRASGEFRKLGDCFPCLWNDIERSFAELSILPHRLYGGLPICVDEASEARFFTSHPLNFQHHDREQGWYFKTLAASPSCVVKAFVNVDSGAVEFDAGFLRGHWVSNECVIDSDLDARSSSSSARLR